MAETHAPPTEEVLLPAGPVAAVSKNRLVRDTLTRASIWLGLAALLFLLWQASNAVLLVFAGLVFGALLEAGMLAVGRVFPFGRGVRLAITLIVLLGLTFGFLTWTGAQLAAQSEMLTATLNDTLARLPELLRSYGLGGMTGDLRGAENVEGAASKLVEMMGGAGSVVAGVLGAMGNTLIIFFIGLFFVADPKTYARGVLWLAPQDLREPLACTAVEVGATLRRWVVGRLIAMVVLGIFTGVGLWLAGVPLALVLGLQTALLAFIPNIGALISGIPIVLVGLSMGPEGGLYALGIYLGAQFIESYILTPYVEKRSVALPPAIVISVQIIFGALFGIAGLALADPLAAVVLVILQQLYIARGLDNPEVLDHGVASEPTMPEVLDSDAASLPQSLDKSVEWPTSATSPPSPPKS